MVALLYFFSRYRPATIIGAPIAIVTPVGSGIQNMINPTFWSFLPGAGAFSNALSDVDVCVWSIFAISEYKEALLLAEPEILRSLSSRAFRGSTMPIKIYKKLDKNQRSSYITLKSTKNNHYQNKKDTQL